MNKRDIKEEFLRKLELFYRNFGDEWIIEDFVNTPKKKKIIEEFLVFLSKKEIITLNLDDQSFKIIDLPSNHKDLL